MRALILLFLLLAGTAHAQQITQNGSCPAGASCTVSGSWTFNGGFGVAGWTPSYGALLTSAGAPVAAGTGYNVGDSITLAGGTCSTQPIVAVTSLTGGAGTGVANFWVSNPGVCSIPPIGTLAQASSSGGGTGATVALSWGPYTPSATSALLGFGGGNYYAGGTGNEAAGYANLTGTEVTYVGVRAGSNATGNYNSAFGFEAGKNATGSQNTYLGTQAGLNAGAGSSQLYVGLGAGLNIAASNTTMLGTNAGRSGTGACSGSVGVGAAALNLCAGQQNTGIGVGALNALAAGNTMTSLGANVGPSCVTSSGSILIGFSSAVDCPASNTSNWLNIGNAIRATLVKPTISSGFGTSPTVPSGTSSAVFTVNVGTGGTATSGVILFATAAPTGWACSVTDQTNPGPNKTMVSASTTTTATFSNYSQTTGIAAAWSASDILVAQCNGY